MCLSFLNFFFLNGKFCKKIRKKSVKILNKFIKHLFCFSFYNLCINENEPECLELTSKGETRTAEEHERNWAKSIFGEFHFRSKVSVEFPNWG